MYRTMVLIRHFEEGVRSLYAAGLVPGLVHLCSGQEAANVGVIAALKRSDFIASHHRGHGHCIAKGTPLPLLMAEILGRAAGISQGRGGTLHMFDPAVGNLGTNGIVGGGIPLATGAALTAKRLRTGQIAVAFFGDGALNQGLLHECMNMAAIWKLPVVFVCENNGYGEYTAIDTVTAGGSLTARGEVFDIPSHMVDGMDVLAVHAAAVAAVSRARAGEGPSFLICNTYRFSGHHAADKQEYKNKEEVKLWAGKDPILRLAGHLREQGIGQEDLDRMESEAAADVAAAVEFGKRSAEPEPALLRSRVYA
ncbi:MAG TPA: thiamine pyrophosphate-dependent dehydrogenase E1 component subunit alpha [Xanthobacteraceae bacterium]|nr:thiamine pyrophosphate-dependent dehydrogenase E1 component subunit alpha [Xanthobacteraceae bacterium]